MACGCHAVQHSAHWEGRGWKQGHQWGHSCNGTDEREQQEKTRLRAKAHLGQAIWRSDISPCRCGVQLAQSLLVGRRQNPWGQLICEHDEHAGTEEPILRHIHSEYGLSHIIRLHDSPAPGVTIRAVLGLLILGCRTFWNKSPGERMNGWSVTPVTNLDPTPLL